MVDAKTMNEDQLNSNKKRIAELSEKNKAMVGKVQELNNKISELTV